MTKDIDMLVKEIDELEVQLTKTKMIMYHFIQSYESTNTIIQEQLESLRKKLKSRFNEVKNGNKI